MAFTLLVHAGAAGTTGAIDTTGATLIVLLVMQDTAAQGVSDSKSNTWTSLTSQTAGGGANNTGRFWYAVNPTVGSGHTFSAAVSYGAILAAAYTGNHATPVDQQNGAANASATSLASGSITPSENNELVLAGLGTGDTTSLFSVDGGFTELDHVNATSFVNYGGVLAELIQTTAAAANPTHSWTGTATAIAVIASFKVPAAAGIAIPVLTRQYRERWS